MGCGSSSLKGDEVHNLSGPAKPHVKSIDTQSTEAETAPEIHPPPAEADRSRQSSVQASIFSTGSEAPLLQNKKKSSTASYKNSIQPIPEWINNTPAINVQEPTEENQKNVSGPGASIRSKMKTAPFSFTSPQPKQKRALTEEDLIKYTGMSSEQLKSWGDKQVYRGKEASTVGGMMGGTMGATYAAQGGIGF